MRLAVAPADHKSLYLLSEFQADIECHAVVSGSFCYKCHFSKQLKLIVFYLNRRKSASATQCFEELLI